MVEKDRRIAKESPQDRLRKIKQTPQGQEMLQRVASAEHHFKKCIKLPRARAMLAMWIGWLK